MQKWVICSLLLCLGWTSRLCAQAFTSLDFESATLVPIPGDPYNRVYFSLALPGWTGYSGTNQLTAALYDNIFLDSTGIGIMDSSFHFLGGIIQGNYTAFLQAGLSLFPGGGSDDASLSQTGLVPIGTKSLSFLAVTNGPFAVSLGGTNLNLISSPVAGQDYSLFQADVSAFAGKTAELTFTLFPEIPHVNDTGLTLDDIMFSPDAIPEPSTVDLVTVVVACLAFCRIARRRTV
jgi:hypothetical protein